MTNHDAREPKVTKQPPASEPEAKAGDDGYFRYDPYDPRAADSGGFGFGGSTGSAGGFGVGGAGPQTGEFGSQANYGAGPEFNARDGATTDELEWTGVAPLGSRPSEPDKNDEAAEAAPVRSNWAEGQVASAPSHSGAAKDSSQT